MKRKRKFVLGVAGYIGSGKTTAGKFFARHGARFIDADEVVDELYLKGGDGYRKILSFFGEEYFDGNGELNRKKLARAVFGDPKKLRILHDLVHPLVTNSVRKIIDREDTDFFVIEATYFEKKHLKALVNAILWIECPKEVLYRRMSSSRKMERALFEKIFRIQVKPSAVDFTVRNDGTKKDFGIELKKILERLRKG
jgi:dephospho-CoA kinase